MFLTKCPPERSADTARSGFLHFAFRVLRARLLRPTLGRSFFRQRRLDGVFPVHINLYAVRSRPGLWLCFHLVTPHQNFVSEIVAADRLFRLQLGHQMFRGLTAVAESKLRAWIEEERAKLRILKQQVLVRENRLAVFEQAMADDSEEFEAFLSLKLTEMNSPGSAVAATQQTDEVPAKKPAPWEHPPLKVEEGERKPPEGGSPRRRPKGVVRDSVLRTLSAVPQPLAAIQARMGGSAKLSAIR